jgi:hypothetical protein
LCRVPAGAEGTARIDEDVEEAVPRVPPGRANGDSAADLDRAVEVGPAVGPVVGNRGGDDIDEGAPGGRLQLPELGNLTRRPVDRELDEARAALLLDPVRRQL